MSSPALLPRKTVRHAFRRQKPYHGDSRILSPTSRRSVMRKGAILAFALAAAGMLSLHATAQPPDNKGDKGDKGPGGKGGFGGKGFGGKGGFQGGGFMNRVPP